MSSAPPDYKVIPGTGFSVDGFRFPHSSIRAYFLSHAHGDHYTGLNENWKDGEIYCTEVTARLVCHITGVKPGYIRILPLNQMVKIYDVEVTVVDAFHCPGAAILLFKAPDGKKYVHCGDMRFARHMLDDECLKAFVSCDTVFLDTTYCHPKHVFPSQDVSIDAIASLCQKYVEEDVPNRLILISAYTIGKEKIFCEVWRRCKIPLLVTARKMEVMKLIEWPPDAPLDKVLTNDINATCIHVVTWNWLGESWPFFRPNFVNMEEYARIHKAKSIVGFVPTGWTYQMGKEEFPVHEKDAWRIHLVPYSEHSSFTELKELVTFLRPRHIVPTVGTSSGDSALRRMLEHFRNLCDMTAAKRTFLAAFEGKEAKKSSSTEVLDEAAPASVTTADLPDPDCADGGGDKPGAAENRGLASVQDSEPAEAPGEEPERNAVDDVNNTAPQAGKQQKLDLTPSSGAAKPAPDPGERHADVLAVLGDAITEADARQLLKRTSGSVEAAINLHYDGLATPAASGAAKRSNEGAAQEGGTTPLNGARSRPAAANKRPLKRAKTTAKPTAKSSAKATTRAQPSIMSFFGAPGKAPSAAASNGSALTALSNGVHIPGPGSQPGSRTGQHPSEACSTKANGVTMVDGDAAPACAEAAPIDMTSCSPPRPDGELEADGVAAAPAANPLRVAELKEEGEHVSRKQAGLMATLKLPALPGRSLSKPGSEPARAPSCSPEGDRPLADGFTVPAAPATGHPTVLTFKPDPASELPGAEGPASSASATVNDATPATPLRDVADDASVSPQLVKAEDSNMQGVITAAGASNGDVQKPSAVVAVNSKSTAKDAAAAPVLLSLDKYDPIKHACWASGPVPYMHVATMFAAMDSTTKRLRIGDALTNMFRSVMAKHPADLTATAFLTVGKIAPEHEGVELQIGESTVASAISDATGVPAKRISALYLTHGDLGDAAELCTRKQATLVPLPALKVRDVYARLRGLADMKGQGSAGRKQRDVAAMIRACRDYETKYLVRTIIRNLRVGANWRSVLPALGRAAACHEAFCAGRAAPPKAALDRAAEAAVEAFHRCPDLAAVVRVLAERDGAGVWELEARCGVALGVPLQPMLAKITTGFEDCVTQITGTAVLAEYKYDGQRAQIHVHGDGRVRIFSRRCEDKTGMFPDVATAILAASNHPCAAAVAAARSGHTLQSPRPAAPTAAPSQTGQAHDALAGPVSETLSFIVDAELVAIDRKTGRLRAFQELSKRARDAVEEGDVSVHVCVFLFDMLHLNGVSLLGETLRARRRAMLSAFPALQPGFVQLAQSVELQVAPSKGAPASAPAHGIKGDSVKAEVAKVDLEDANVQAEATSSGDQQPVKSPDEGHEDQVAQCSNRKQHLAAELEAQQEGVAATEGAPSEGAVAAHLDGLSVEASRGKGDGASTSKVASNPKVMALPAFQAAEALERLLLAAVAEGTEGLMLKFLDTRSAYAPSKRSDSWLKVKRDYCENLRDSLDLVVIGAWHGNGRKAGWYSPFLLACYDPEREEFQSVCRCMSGFSDAFYAASKERFDSHHLIPKKRPYYNTRENPDVWFDATEVWEIRGADLTISPVHCSAIGRLHPERGCSLRFPRFIQVRDDKSPEEASSAENIVALFNAQTRKADM